MSNALIRNAIRIETEQQLQDMLINNVPFVETTDSHSGNMVYMRQIPTMPNYWVMSNGRIFNAKSGKLLAVTKNATGYDQKNLTHADGMVNIYTARLVASAFILNDDPTVKTDVDHIDNDPLNNCSHNLQWLSHSENSKRRGSSNNWAPPVRLSKIDVEFIKQSLVDGSMSQYELSKMYGCHQGSISMIKQLRSHRAVAEHLNAALLNT